MKISEKIKTAYKNSRDYIRGYDIKTTPYLSANHNGLPPGWLLLFA